MFVNTICYHYPLEFKLDYFFYIMFLMYFIYVSFFLFFLSRPSFQSFFPNGIFRSFVFLFFLITGNQIQKWNSKKNPSIFQNSFPRFIKYQSIHQSVFEKYLCSSRINKWHVTHQLNFITRA